MPNITTFRFDEHFLHHHPDRLQELAVFYASIWMYDPNFKEYKQCPNISCRRYFSYDEVEIQGIRVCRGTEGQPHLIEFIQDAWDPNEVAEEILELTKMDGDFFGAISIDNDTNKIIGFTWGFVRDIEDVAKSWGSAVADQISAPTNLVTYYSEIASDPSYRNLGVGSTLCRMLTSWMKENHPNLPSLLRTHRNSPARRLFEKVGYQIFADDTMYGGGRVMLKIDKGSYLSPEALS